MPADSPSAKPSSPFWRECIEQSLSNLGKSIYPHTFFKKKKKNQIQGCICNSCYSIIYCKDAVSHVGWELYVDKAPAPGEPLENPWMPHLTLSLIYQHMFPIFVTSIFFYSDSMQIFWHNYFYLFYRACFHLIFWQDRKEKDQCKTLTT